MHFYHVTSSGNVTRILEEGLLPGWGDVGLGVYVFNTEASARQYAANSGWDGALPDPVILKLEAGPDEVERVMPHPEWSDPEAYENISWRPSNVEDEAWMPTSMEILEDQAPRP